MSKVIKITDTNLAEELELLVDDRIQFIMRNIHHNPEPLGKKLVLLKEFHKNLQLMQLEVSKEKSCPKA